MRNRFANGVITATAIAAFLLCGLSGCNTLRGVGQDVEEGGEKIQDVAE